MTTDDAKKGSQNDKIVENNNYNSNLIQKTRAFSPVD